MEERQIPFLFSRKQVNFLISILTDIWETNSFFIKIYREDLCIKIHSDDYIEFSSSNQVLEMIESILKELGYDVNVLKTSEDSGANINERF